MKGIGSLPSSYDSEKRQIAVETEFKENPALATAALLQSMVHDLLATNGMTSAVPGEFLDAAVVLCGLGGPRAEVELISEGGSFWDATRWDANPGNFLDQESLAYAHSLAVWCRDGNPDSLPASMRTAKGSLKYLTKTNDSFFQQGLVTNDQLGLDTFVDLAANGKESTRIAAMQFFHSDQSTGDKQAAAILENLRHRNDHVVGHAISAAQSTQTASTDVIEELKALTENRDDRLRSKAVQAVTLMGQLDDHVADNAARMLSSSTNYVTYSGLLALAKSDQVSDDVLKLADRGFERALHSCNYQFIELFAGAYNRWLDDPTAHLKNLWGERSPEYYQMAVEALNALTDTDQADEAKQAS